MKKLLCVLSVLSILITLNACTIQITFGNPNKTTEETTTTAETTEATTTATTAKETTAKKTTAKKTTTKKTTKKTTLKTTAKKNINNLYADLKNWLKKNGRSEGDVLIVTKDPSLYGVSIQKTFEISYSDTNEIIQFCFTSSSETILDILCLEIPETYCGSYHYDTGMYNTKTGYQEYYYAGDIVAADFTQDTTQIFEGTSRFVIGQLLDCIAGFLERENFVYTLEDMGFVNY